MVLHDGSSFFMMADGCIKFFIEILWFVMMVLANVHEDS